MSELKERVAELIEAHREGRAPIVEAGDPVLRTRAAEYDGQLDELFPDFVALMLRTMKDKGVGLAAPQIGVPLRILALGDPVRLSEEVAEARQRRPFEPFVMVNPRPKPLRWQGRARHYEGCLSVPGYSGVVNRWRAVKALYLDPSGENQVLRAHGWIGRIIQHEVDHLDGVLYLDRAEPRSLSTTKIFLDRWNTPHPVTAAEVLGFRLRRKQRPRHMPNAA